MCVHSRMLGDPHADILARLADVSALRSQVHAANIANQNTPGYKTQRVRFEEAFREALATGGSTDEVQPEIYQPRSSAVQPDGNDVSVDREVLEQGQNNALYNTYLALMQGRKKLMTIATSNTPGG